MFVDALVGRLIANAHASVADRGQLSTRSVPLDELGGIGPLFTAPLSDDESDEEGEEPLRTALPSEHGPFLRNAARPGSCVSVWHDVIPSESQRRALKCDAEKIVGETFWIGVDEEPSCALEDLAMSVLRFHADRAPPGLCGGVHSFASTANDAARPSACTRTRLLPQADERCRDRLPLKMPPMVPPPVMPTLAISLGVRISVHS